MTQVATEQTAPSIEDSRPVTMGQMKDILDLVVEKTETRRIPVEDTSELASYLDTAQFEQLYRAAKMLAKSNMVPEHYRTGTGSKAESAARAALIAAGFSAGQAQAQLEKAAEGNCFIALCLSRRAGVDVFALMQKTYVVHGKIGMESQLVIAMVNRSGVFNDRIDWEVMGGDTGDPFDPEYRVRAFATRKDGKRVNGTWINWKLVQSEQWDKKDGSKWLTMPEQMFHYRAAVFFARLHAPDAMMGMETLEELDDSGTEKKADPKPQDSKLADLKLAAKENPTKPADSGAAAHPGPGPSARGQVATPEPSQPAASTAPAGNGAVKSTRHAAPAVEKPSAEAAQVEAQAQAKSDPMTAAKKFASEIASVGKGIDFLMKIESKHREAMKKHMNVTDLAAVGDLEEMREIVTCARFLQLGGVYQ